MTFAMPSIGSRPAPPSRGDNIALAVLGTVGSGKSTFVQHLIGEKIRTSHSLEITNTSLNVYHCPFPDGSGGNLILLDSPGLDDPDRSDMETLQSVQQWSATVQIPLSGVLYFIRISDNRMSGTSIKQLTLLRTLFQAPGGSLNHIALVTSMNDIVDLETRSRREEALRTRYWGPMIQRGSRIVASLNTAESARNIVLSFAPKRDSTSISAPPPQPPITPTEPLTPHDSILSNATTISPGDVPPAALPPPPDAPPSPTDPPPPPADVPLAEAHPVDELRLSQLIALNNAVLDELALEPGVEPDTSPSTPDTQDTTNSDISEDQTRNGVSEDHSGTSFGALAEGTQAEGLDNRSHLAPSESTDVLLSSPKSLGRRGCLKQLRRGLVQILEVLIYFLLSWRRIRRSSVYVSNVH